MFPALPPPTPAALAAPSAQAAPAASTEPQQRVDSHGYHYIVVGNHLLTPIEVERALALGADPRAAVGALKQAYEARGYFLVALVGTEHGKDVTLRVIQGRITHIEGPPHLAAFFNGLKENDTLRKDDIIRPSLLAQAYAATNGQQPQVNFSPAPEVGGSTMHIGETPLAGSHTFGGGVTLGNFGNRYAGHYLAQGQVSAQHNGMTVQVNYARALTGLDPNTYGAFYSATSANFSAITPLGVFGLDGNITNYRLGDKFAPLFPTGRIRVFGGTATQLVYADDAHRWSLNEGIHRIHDSTTVFSGLFTLSDRRFTVVDFGSTFSWNFGGLFHRPAVFTASGGVKLGAAGANEGFTRAPGAPESHFKIYTASVEATQAFAHDYSVKVSVSGQATPYTLPSYEQWVLGGINNLSAYLPGTIVGDRGYLGRITAQGPLWSFGFLRVRPSVFVEHGASRFSYIAPQAPVWQALTDAGVGLNLNLPHVSGLLAWAKPMDSRDVSPTLRHTQRSHLFFFLQAAF